MALSGTLMDMRTIDLVQYPHSGRKTGELVLSGPHDEARLFYEKGKLVHAALGALTGMDALVELLGWSDGEFQFHQGVATEQRTIDLDLHRTIMQALKLRDERRREESERQVQPAPLQLRLDEIVNDAASLLQVAILASDGRVLANHCRDDSAQASNDTMAVLARTVAGHPRPGLKRIFAEDAGGMIVLQALSSGNVLTVIAGSDATLGAVSRHATKISDALEEPSS